LISNAREIWHSQSLALARASVMGGMSCLARRFRRGCKIAAPYSWRTPDLVWLVDVSMPLERGLGCDVQSLVILCRGSLQQDSGRPVINNDMCPSALPPPRWCVLVSRAGHRNQLSCPRPSQSLSRCQRYLFLPWDACRLHAVCSGDQRTGALNSHTHTLHRH
jgi:hypothetical protein